MDSWEDRSCTHQRSGSGLLGWCWTIGGSIVGSGPECCSIRRFDRVVANPPFVRIGKLEEALRRPALATPLNGFNIIAMANYWVAFLIAGMRLLKPGGSLSYVLPAAWEYADYASGVRSLCAESFYELDVHRVAVPMFDGIADGSVLMVGHGFGRRPHREPQMIRHTTLPALNDAVYANDFPAATVSGMREHESRLPEGQVRFGEIAKIGIGAVTGDARFFLFNEARRLDLRLPHSTVRPVLSKARRIISSEIDRDTWTRLLTAGNRVWLFDPSEADLSNSAVRTYLELTAEEGGCRRDAMKVRLRDPWYKSRTASMDSSRACPSPRPGWHSTVCQVSQR